MRLTLFGGFSFGKNVGKYGKIAVFPGGYRQIAVYRVKFCLTCRLLEKITVKLTIRPLLKFDQ